MSMLMKNRRLVAIIGCCLALYLTWGMVYLTINFALESFPPVLLSAMRFTAAGSLLLGYSILVSKKFRLPKGISEWRVVLWSSFFMIALSGMTLNIGSQYLSSGSVAILAGSLPVWMVVAGYVFRVDPRPSNMVIVGLVVGFAGVVLLVTSLGHSASGSITGVLIIIASLWAWIAGSFYARERPIQLPIFVSLGMQMVVGGLFMFVVAFFIGEYEAFQLANVTPVAFLSYLHLVFFGSVVGYGCYYWLLMNTTTPIATSYAYAEPVVALSLGVILAGEKITSVTILSCALIIGAVFFVTRGKSARQ